MTPKPRFTGNRSEAHKKRALLAVRRLRNRCAKEGKDHHWVARKLNVKPGTVRRWYREDPLPWGQNLLNVVDLHQSMRRADHNTKMAEQAFDSIGERKAETPQQMELNLEHTPVAARVAVDSFLRLDLMTLQELLELVAHVNLEIAKKLPQAGGKETT